MLAVLAVAIAANAGALLSTNSRMAGDSDGPFYIGIARSLAAGRGYVLEGMGLTFWPDTPTMGRAPLWPALLTVPALLAPSFDDSSLLRVTAACLNALNALLLFGIAWELSRSVGVSVAAGISYALYPVALALTAGGFSEISYVFVTAAGILLIVRGGRLVYLGALVLGLSALVRSNFVVLPVVAGLVAFPKLTTARARRRFLTMAAVFWLPSGLWIARNYILSGEFPVLSTIEGETLYGANNNYVASSLQVWGYWVMPNEIPGETPKKDLAQTMSERQLDRYYHRQGMTFLKLHWFELPRLELGKLIRAFIPIPWVPNWASYAVFFSRAVLYVGILLSLGTLREMAVPFRILVTSMFLVVLLTVLVYYGTYRFTFCVEVFFLPVLSVAAFKTMSQHWPDAFRGVS